MLVWKSTRESDQIGFCFRQDYEKRLLQLLCKPLLPESRAFEMDAIVQIFVGQHSAIRRTPALGVQPCNSRGVVPSTIAECHHRSEHHIAPRLPPETASASQGWVQGF